MTESNHREVKGVIPMGPGHRVTGACACGWHSHTKTFEQHMEEVSNG